MWEDIQARKLDAAIQGAREFLAAAQGKTGEWREFETLAGASDEWVTAYVACALAAAGAAAEARCGWNFLRRSRFLSGGWGYNRRVPPDADSTIWGWKLASMLGEGNDRKAVRALRFLASHIDASGATRTYAVAGPIRWFTRLTSDISFAGWCQPHPCVAAVAAWALPPAACPLDYILCQQQPDGAWRSYWWVAREYATAWAVAALEIRDAAGYAARISRAARWAETLEKSEPACNDVFVRALRLRILAAAPCSSEPRLLAETLKGLLDAQSGSGAWPPSARLRIPFPGMAEPDRQEHWTLGGRAGGSIQIDGHSLFTTATALLVLANLRAKSTCL